MINWLKAGATVIAISLAVARTLWPDLQIDTVTLGLLALAVLPWISRFLKDVELPGGVKIHLKDIQRAAQSIEHRTAADSATMREGARPSYLSLRETDPNLALAGLRIEIEKRLRSLAAKHGLVSSSSLSSLICDLLDNNVIPTPTAEGLRDLVNAGNQAVHGAELDRDIVEWSFEQGPRVLAVLDAEIVAGDSEEQRSWLGRAFTILDFEGEGVRDACSKVLARARHEDGVALGVAPHGVTNRAREVLERLGALRRRDGSQAPGRMIQYDITGNGEALLARLQ